MTPATQTTDTTIPTMVSPRPRTTVQAYAAMVLELLCGDDAACWQRLGFQVDAGALAVGAVTVRCDGEGGGIRGWTLQGASGPREVAGIPTKWSSSGPGPQGRFGLDHIVLFTGRLDASIADLVASGGDE